MPSGLNVSSICPGARSRISTKAVFLRFCRISTDSIPYSSSNPSSSMLNVITVFVTPSGMRWISLSVLRTTRPFVPSYVPPKIRILSPSSIIGPSSSGTTPKFSAGCRFSASFDCSWTSAIYTLFRKKCVKNVLHFFKKKCAKNLQHFLQAEP